VMRRLAWFVAVGCTAAAVHFGVVVGLVSQAGWPPLQANFFGWLAAVGVSYFGHHRLTFSQARAPAWRAARRFILLSAAGFAINEGSYALLLHGTGIGYRAALALVLVGVALFTYWASRRWAFASSTA
jgi:putative flippase GtrA